MRVEQRLVRAVRETARRATEARVEVRRLTTRQARGADAAVEAISAGSLSGGTALTTQDMEGSTLRYFMVGQDGFGEDESWVLG